MGYNDKPDTMISENTILDFHLSHRTNPNFSFEPKKKYTASNLEIFINI